MKYLFIVAFPIQFLFSSRNRHCDGRIGAVCASHSVPIHIKRMRSNLFASLHLSEREMNLWWRKSEFAKEVKKKNKGLNVNNALRSSAAVHRLHCAIRWWIRHIQIPLSSISCGLKTNRKTERNNRAKKEMGTHWLGMESRCQGIWHVVKWCRCSWLFYEQLASEWGFSIVVERYSITNENYDWRLDTHTAFCIKCGEASRCSTQSRFYILFMRLLFLFSSPI